MAPSFTLWVLALTRFLISDVSCVAITADSAIMRTEKKAAMELGASGELRSSAYDESSADGFCNDDFPLGAEGQCDCADTTKHTIIEQEEMCIEAAKQAGVSTLPGKFRLESNWFNYHPKGCFKDVCSSDPKGQCYFFNPTETVAKCANIFMMDGSQPAVTGVPVCRRPKYLYGTVFAGGAFTDAGCPDQYGVVMDENNCTQAASCLGEADGDEFRVTALNLSQHHDFPMGCFNNTHKFDEGFVLGRVYYNPAIDGLGNPTDAYGTPICNVTVRTWINGGEVGTSTVNVEDRAGSDNGAHASHAAMTTPSLMGLM